MMAFEYQISRLGDPLVDILVHIDSHIFQFLFFDNLYFTIIWFLFFSVVAVLLVVAVGWGSPSNP